MFIVCWKVGGILRIILLAFYCSPKLPLFRRFSFKKTQNLLHNKSNLLWHLRCVSPLRYFNKAIHASSEYCKNKRMVNTKSLWSNHVYMGCLLYPREGECCLLELLQIQSRRMDGEALNIEAIKSSWKIPLANRLFYWKNQSAKPQFNLLDVRHRINRFPTPSPCPSLPLHPCHPIFHFDPRLPASPPFRLLEFTTIELDASNAISSLWPGEEKLAGADGCFGGNPPDIRDLYVSLMDHIFFPRHPAKIWSVLGKWNGII